MGFEVVREIISTEKEGMELVEKAKAEALELHNKTVRDASTIISEAERKAQEAYDKLIKEYEEAAREEEGLIIQKSHIERDRILSIQLERRDKAVDLVIERIVSGVGNS